MRRLRANLGIKLFLSYLCVVLVGVVAFFIVASNLAPTFFNQSMQSMMGGQGAGGMMGGAFPSSQSLDDAFRAALMRALLLAAALATGVALALSVFVAGQIMGPLRRILSATRRIGSGHYAERVQIPRANAGDELGQLAQSFNQMAASLEQTERRRLELVGDIAHELRTPITTLQGYLEGLLDGVVESSPETWAKLHTEAGRLRRLVDDLQELSRAEARQIPLSIRPVPAAAIVQTAVERLRPQFEEKGLTLTTSLPDAPLDVLADQDRAVQVLTNLLSNALRYTPAPGAVSVSLVSRGSSAAFQVADTGIGLAPQDLERLFERFYRVDKSRSRALGGSGIGLTIARALTEAMGGRIMAESLGPGHGSTFTFTLPLARAHAYHPASVPLYA